jgi:hypothetical protein
MASRMTVLAVRHTGHVLGALSAIAPGDAPSAESVAGAAMPVYLDPVSFPVPAASLAVADLAFDERVFEDPHRARVVFPGASDESPYLAFVDTTAHGELGSSVGPSTLQVATNPVTAAPTGGLPFWVLFQAQAPATDPPVVVAGVIPETKSASDPVAHGLTAGITYDALVLVTGMAVHLDAGITP